MQLLFGLNTSKRVNGKQRVLWGVVRELGRTLIFKDVLGDGEEFAYLPVYTRKAQESLKQGCDL